MRFKQNFLRLSLVSAALIMVGCGRSGSLNQTTMPLANNTAAAGTALAAPTGSATYMAPVAQTTGSAQATAGGRAVATSGGYVYEQDPSTNNTAYNYYNQQNPCLFPQAGQQVACQGANSYYAGNQPQQSTGAYPQYAAPATNYAGAYPAQGGYPQQNTAYAQQNTAYAQQASAYPQQGSAYTQQTAAYPQTNTAYTQQTPAYSSYSAQNAAPAPTASSAANKAQSRINPNPVSGQSNGSGKVSF